jgi:ABC-2 type transport system permease protein
VIENRFWPVTVAVAKRHVRKFIRSGNLVPSLLFPCLFLAAFVGGLSAISSNASFGYPNYTSFIFVFVLLLGTAYTAIFSALAFTADLEGRFFSRMMLAVPRRTAILAGLVLAGVGEALAVALILTGIGLAAGMKVSGSAVQLLGLLALALLLNIAASCWGLGLAFRMRSAQAAPVMLLPLFAVLFVTPVYVPRHLLGGWLKPAAAANPLTPLLEAGRGLLVHAPERVGVAFAASAGLILVFYVFALTGLRKLERGA